ncbi:putative quinol monooxygenase [Taibaiella koreensis]|uniref:putative quinol monooxygenase n=1 Tax=Taibaiella koreensis TaxID=1268548 RepID=UPI000E59971D|nr:putative quinol monooxygenase [Taibaiella koreensis]
MNIHLTAIIRSKPAYIDNVKALLENMVLHSRQEAACLQYDLHQGTDDPALFTFYEIWENAAALEQHNTQPYIRAFAAIAGEQLQEPPAIYTTTLIS